MTAIVFTTVIANVNYLSHFLSDFRERTVLSASSLGFRNELHNLARQAVKFQEKTGKPAASALREESQRGHNMPYCRSHEKRAREVSWSSPSLILSSISFSSIISSHFVLPSQPACGKDE